MEMLTVTIDARGQVTIPKEILRELGVGDVATLTVEISPTGAIPLQPLWPADDDSWADTPEHRAGVARALTDEREGGVRRLTEEELWHMTGIADGHA